MYRRRFTALTTTSIALGLAGCTDSRVESPLPQTTVQSETTTNASTSCDPPISEPSSERDGETGTPVDQRAPPSYDCTEIVRPEPAASDSDDEDAVTPLEYPDRPDDVTNSTAVQEYVEEYERAYRRNESVTQFGEELVSFQISPRDQRVYDAPPGAALVRIEYVYSETVEESDGLVAVADSPTIFTTYYVDDTVVIRAEDNGMLEDADTLDPDPWKVGEPVECFE